MQTGLVHLLAKHNDRKGHHYYTSASQANAGVYSSDDPCGHHAHTLHVLCGLNRWTSTGWGTALRRCRPLAGG
jgi:hypothetical protein